MFEKLLIWLRGYYIIRVQECNILFFLNICNVNNVILSNVQHHHDEYFFRIAASDYAELLKISNEYNLNFEIHKQCGLKKLLRKCIAEKAFLCSIFLFILIIMLAANISLEVNVKSLEPLKYISEAQILEFAAECNVKKWRFIPMMDFDYAEEYISRKSEYISFAAITRDGTEIQIEVKERQMLDEEDKPMPFGNIIAQCDAVIEEIFVLGGTAMVKQGEAVSAGQVLIAGVEHGIPAAAQGIIKARVIYEGTAEIPIIQEKFNLTGESSSTLYLCWDDLAQIIIAGEKPVPYEYFDSSDEKIKLNIAGIELPFFLLKRKFYEQVVEQVELELHEAQDIAYEIALAQAISQLPLIGSQILSKSNEFMINEWGIGAKVLIEAIRDFGIFQPYI